MRTISGLKPRDGGGVGGSAIPVTVAGGAGTPALVWDAHAPTQKEAPVSTSVPECALNDGTTLPQIGFGTWPLKGADAERAVASALACGYRLIDSAVNYENEEAVGAAVRAAGVPRDEILVATKIPGRFHAHDLAVASVEESLRRMRLDRLDLVLIHWPNPSVGKYVEAWQGLVEARERGLVRSIGVSNFTERHLDDVIAATGVTPVVNQIEMHPAFPQAEMRQVHRRLGIVTQAWSPLGKGATLESPPVAAAARRHGVTGGQVVLRWEIQRGVVPVPKSADPGRQSENLDVFGFALSDAELAAIDALGRPDGRLFDGDPDTHEEM